MVWQKEHLWKKGRCDGKSIYVDVFDGIDSAFSGLDIGFNLATGSSTFKKDGFAALHDMDIFKEMVREKACPDALIRQVNKILCRADTEYNRVGSAYALRAQCFEGIKQYSLCLADVGMAEKYGCAFETILWPDFETIKNKCLEILKSDERKDPPEIDGPKLSFPANERIPCFAQVLEVKQSKKFGKHVIANEDLEIGQTVIIEEAYCIALENNEKYSYCANCLEPKGNLMPCENCAAVMFCSQSCYDAGHEKFHTFECGKPNIYKLDAVNRVMMRTVINALKLFPNINGLMELVGKFKARPNSQFNYSDLSVRAYMQFFSLSLSIERSTPLEDHLFLVAAKTAHEIITSDAAYSPSFRSPEASRFLAHLILHHTYIIDEHGVGSLSLLHGPYKTELGTRGNYGSGVVYGRGIYPNSSQLNHSCQPNIACIFMGTKLIGKVLRPIKRGEQLFVTYINPANLLMPTERRNEFLEGVYHFKCKCKSCVSNLPPSGMSKNVDLDVPICRLLNIFNIGPSGDQHTVNELLTFEKSAIKFLKSNDHCHPTGETLMIQFLLMQIWNNLGR